MTDDSKSKYRFVLTGSRDFTSKDQHVLDILIADHFTDRDGDISPWPGMAIQHGGARGFDMLADDELRSRGFEPYIKIVKPDYNKYAAQPRYAPVARNMDMINWAVAGEYGAVMATLPKDVKFLDEGGTARTIAYGIECGLDVFIYRFDRG